MDVIELNEGLRRRGLAVLRDLEFWPTTTGASTSGAEPSPWATALDCLGRARHNHHGVDQLHEAGGRYALRTMCIGVGRGIAVVLEPRMTLPGRCAALTPRVPATSLSGM